MGIEFGGDPEPICVNTAISRKVVGEKCACDNPERNYGI